MVHQQEDLIVPPLSPPLLIIETVVTTEWSHANIMKYVILAAVLFLTAISGNGVCQAELITGK